MPGPSVAWPTAASGWSCRRAVGSWSHTSSIRPIDYIPAGIPSKRHPGAPADALDMQYDTVPFELFPQNFPAVRPIDIAPGTESLTCDLTFDSGVTRTGTVMDPEGRPLSGVSMIGETFRNTWRIHAAGRPGIHRVRAEHQSPAAPDADLPPRGPGAGQGPADRRQRSRPDRGPARADGLGHGPPARWDRPALRRGRSPRLAVDR